MASGAMRGTLRHLRDLFDGGTAVGFSDGQLLARYTNSRDESAFEALVARHGPMVLATCRAVLKHEHDVEDAFQATFLVLARKAHSVRVGDVLGGWLHRVAYRAAVQASVDSRRRRVVEAAAMATLDATHTEPDPEIRSIVHEELDRLPDRQRLPVILCDLEGLTYEQAARRLQWTEPTLRHRLSKARLRLRDRLIRRGFTAGSIGVSLAGSTAGARAAVPAALAHSAIGAVAGDASSATVVALTAIVIRSLPLTKLKIASAGILAAIALATAGFVAVGAMRPDEPERVLRVPGVVTVTAVVVPTPPRDLDAEQQAPAGAGPEIEGRIIDLEGRPVAGALVEFTDLWSAPDNDLGRWLERARDRGVAYPSEGLSPRNVASRPAVSTSSPNPSSRSPGNPTATTGPDGRFRLTGVGPQQLAAIQVTGPTIATTQLYIMGRDGAEVRATNHGRLTPNQVVYHARQFDYAAAPGKPIEGVVRDKDDGHPLAGIALRAAVYDERSLIPAPGIEAATDDRGHYRLVGLPRASAYRLFVEPGDGKPYPKATLRISGDTPAFEPVRFDVALKRGILVRGNVTDKATGQPVSASVDVFAFEDNPHIRDYPGYRSSSLARGFVANGRYEVVALPGRGIIGVRVGGYLPRYRGEVGAEAIKGYDPKLMSFRTQPQYCMISNYHALAELDLDPKAESATLDLQVDPGRTIAATAVDPEGQPIGGTTVAGVSDLFTSTEITEPSPTFEIYALDPSRPRRVIVTHAGRKLIGSVYLKGDEAGPLTIPLRPYGTIIGRIVDEAGRPRGGVGIMSIGGSLPERPAEQGILPGGNVGGGIRIGRDGRFRIEGLIPGLKYGANASEADGVKYLGDLFRDLTVTPGDVKDLGDLKGIPPKRDN